MVGKSLSHTCSQPWLHLHAHSSNSHICAFTFNLVYSYSYSQTCTYTNTHFHILPHAPLILILTHPHTYACTLTHLYPLTQTHAQTHNTHWHTITFSHIDAYVHICSHPHTYSHLHGHTPTLMHIHIHPPTPTKSTCSKWSWVSLCHWVKSKGDPGGSSLWTFSFCSWEENQRHLGCSRSLFVGYFATWCCLDVTSYLLQI